MTDYLSFLGWMFLPQLVTNWVQKLYYKTFYPRGANIPKPGQPKYIRHHNRIYTLIVLTYLVYTIYEIDQKIQPNYYGFLDVNFNFTTKEIKANFKKLQLQYHPDKNPGEETESIYIHIRTAYDTLTDPTKRFAYDRFGPEASKWQHCTTVHDYLNNGWVSSYAGFYLGTGLILIILDLLGRGQFGRFWRFVAFFGLACLEARMILHPKPFSIMSLVMPKRVLFEQIIILREVFMATFFGISQVGPVLFPPNSTNIRDSLAQIEALSYIAAEESTNQLRAGFEPFIENNQAAVKKKMEELAVETYLHSNPGFNQMYSAARQRLATRRKNS